VKQLTLRYKLFSFKWLVGAAREIRTPDPIITNDVLYQLSYCGPRRPTPARGASQTALLSMPFFPVLAIRLSEAPKAPHG
jgi:hypothetical protein